MSDPNSWKVQAKQSFLETRDPARLKEIKVEEWGRSVYFWPSMTLDERQTVNLAHDQGGDWAGIRETIIVRVRDQGGNLLFTPSERDDLRLKYDPMVLKNIVLAMIPETPAVTPEDAEKN
jgi:hypothetical protein